jgi:hypothetical protein
VGGNALHVGRHRSKGKERGQASCLSFSTDILGKADVHFLNGTVEQFLKKQRQLCVGASVCYSLGLTNSLRLFEFVFAFKLSNLPGLKSTWIIFV